MSRVWNRRGRSDMWSSGWVGTGDTGTEWGWRRDKASWFQRHGEAYRKERSLILREDAVGGRARVTTYKYRVLRLIRADILFAYKVLFGLTAVHSDDFFILSKSTCTRGHPYELFYRVVQLMSASIFFLPPYRKKSGINYQLTQISSVLIHSIAHLTVLTLQLTMTFDTRS